MYCEKTKDHLIGLLNGAESEEQTTLANMASLCEVCDTIIVVLTHTEGLWLECEYAYKAAEIACRAGKQVDAYLTDENTHHASKRKLEAVKMKLRLIEERYFRLNHEQRTPGNPVVEHCHAG